LQAVEQSQRTMQSDQSE